MHNIRLSRLIIFFLIFVTANGFTHFVAKDDASIAGAWKVTQGTIEHVLIFADGYFTYTSYDKSKKEFLGSEGGTYQLENNKIITKEEFNSTEKEKVSETKNHAFSRAFDQGVDQLTLNINGTELKWKRLDDGSGTLAGTWRISGRMQNDKMNPIDTGPRKTLKILSGTRFQWVAMNTETKEFFGTGGGTYTFVNGKYTETIDFFSRDSSRVGVSLSFDGKVENDEWHHSGTSSRGQKIHEVWSRVR